MRDLTSSVVKSGILDLPQSDFELLLRNIKERALLGEFDDRKHISQDIIERFRTAGVYRALVPKRFGGKESTPFDFCQLIECLAEADGSAGWVASFGMSPFYLSALPLRTQEALYSTDKGADIIFAGGIFPTQPATLIDNGLKLNGRWRYSSGCMGADVIGVGIQPESAEGKQLPRVAVLPRSEVTIDPTWNTVGLMGTGSHDLIVNDVFVPEEWTFIRGGHPNLEEPLFRYPSLSFATQVLSVVAIGVARRAINEVRRLSDQTMSVTGAPTTAQKPTAKVEIAKAEANFQALRSYFYESLRIVWSCISKGEELLDDQISMLRLSSTNAAHEAAKICRNMQLLLGMTGVLKSHPVARCVNDTMVITQHAFMGEMSYINAGTMLCGQSPAPGYL